MFNQEMYKKGIKSSAIRELFEYGKIRKREIGDDKVFDFSIGNPSVPAPDFVNETLINLLQNSDSAELHSYTSAVGDLDVRTSVAEYLNKTYNVEFDPYLIYMTVGAASSLAIAFNALLYPDEEIILLAPHFPEYNMFVTSAKGKPVVVMPDPKTFYPDLKDLESKITPKTKAIIVNSPNNPSGAVYPEYVLEGIAEVLNKKSAEYNHPIFIISDEPYRELVYGDKRAPFVANFYDNTIICYSFSKSLSLPGERIGYLVVNSKATDAKNLYRAVCGAARSLGYICAPALFQKMVPYCLGLTSDLSVYKKNRDLLYKGLTELGYEVVKPEGAFYLFVKSLESDANKFSDAAKKHELLIVPSDSFGYPGYVRVSYCVSTKQIIDGLPIFKELMDEYKGKNHHE